MHMDRKLDLLVVAALAAFGAFAGGEFSHYGYTAKWSDKVLEVFVLEKLDYIWVMVARRQESKHE